MWRSRLHLISNLVLGLFITAIPALILLTRLGSLWSRIAVIAVALIVVFPLSAHRLAPRVTGRLVDRIADRTGLDN